MDDLRKKRLRQHDSLWLGAGVFAAALFALISVILPGQGWPSFGAFMLCIVAVGWWISRRREFRDSKQPKPAVDPAKRMMRSARLVAVINGTLLILAGPLWALMPLTDPDYAWWLRIALALLYLGIGSGSGCVALWWGLRKRPPAGVDAPVT